MRDREFAIISTVIIRSILVSKKTWIIFIVIVIGLLVGLVLWSRGSTPQVDVSNVDPNTVMAASSANGNIGDHVLGKADSKVLLIEYGDFQCPGCGTAHPRIKAIMNEYKEQIGFVFRNFPLTSIHPNARAASAAAEAAGQSGYYWEMHDRLFESQNAWENLSGAQRTDTFASYAEALGINRETFTTNLALESVNQKISFDQALGKKVSVDSTPTFILNGVKLDKNVWGDDAKLKEAINAELTKAGIALPSTN